MEAIFFEGPGFGRRGGGNSGGLLDRDARGLFLGLLLHGLPSASHPRALSGSRLLPGLLFLRLGTFRILGSKRESGPRTTQ